MQTLSKNEIQTIRHALFCRRRVQRDLANLAREEKTDKAERAYSRLQTLISRNLELDEKLSDMGEFAK